MIIMSKWLKLLLFTPRVAILDGVIIGRMYKKKESDFINSCSFFFLATESHRKTDNTVYVANTLKAAPEPTKAKCHG